MSNIKKITFTVPCYNSSQYMRKCIDSLLVGKDEVEIIIVNDGSHDKTGEIADEYQKKYPNIIKAIHKENGGHGSGVNAGLKEARGLYFKVVDSDDWLDEKDLKKLLKNIKVKKDTPDLIVCNYIYDHTNTNEKRIMSFDNVFKDGKLCTWNEINKFKPSQYLIMHSLIFKTDILRKSKINLPKHTFYVDNIVAYQPLPYVKSIMYYNLDLYHYFIGRDDQTVNEKVMITKVDQQIKVTKLIVKAANLEEVKKQSKKLYKYMLKNVSMMVMISTVYLLMIGDKEAFDKRKELWEYIKNTDIKLYRKLRINSLSGLTYILKGKLGGLITLSGYRISKKIYKFN